VAVFVTLVKGPWTGGSAVRCGKPLQLKAVSIPKVESLNGLYCRG